MNSYGIAYLKRIIGELHPDAKIDQDTVRIPLESYRLATMTDNLNFFSMGMVLSLFLILLGTNIIGTGTLQGIVSGSVFVLIGSVGLFFSLRTFDHFTDLMDKGETVLIVIRKIRARERMK